MRVTEFRCWPSVIHNVQIPIWYRENKLVMSSRRKGWFWGTCIFCGRRHYDRVPKALAFTVK